MAQLDFTMNFALIAEMIESPDIFVFLYRYMFLSFPICTGGVMMTLLSQCPKADLLYPKYLWYTMYAALMKRLFFKVRLMSIIMLVFY